ncbi:MAG TPA: toll/interleukin-1 receptor domain-containing protein [Ensifer sp.]|nr:toll/interleukin-1 receptor domain-containing protein [Ensifer sp.]
MKVFISWSGKRSQALAQALREWLPLVLHYVEPWVSESDIAAGDRWAQSIAGELEASNFGILCVTPENLNSQWVLFEAGALAKSMQEAKVIPLLFGLEFSDISGPLAQFQAKKFEKSGLGEVIHSINSVSDEKEPEDRTKQRFALAWPQLEETVSKIPNQAPAEQHSRPQTEILEELVAGVRGLDARMQDLVIDVVERGIRSSRSKQRRFHPAMLDEISELSGDEDPISLLVLAGYVREDMPWLAEILSELYREVKNAGPHDREKVSLRARRLMKMLDRGPFFERFAGDSKESYMMLREMPMIVDRVIHRSISRIRSPEEKDEDQGEV